MPRYSPLPSVSLDPRTEAEIVQQASQVVYEASNQTLNDFSSGNPLAALLEGQAFAQGEFLFWANQLPQSILLEWIGPFLGAMRRLGTASVAQLVLSIAPTDSQTLIPAGTPFTTNANLTGGNSITFVSNTDAIIPAGETTVRVGVSSQFVGSEYNAPAGSITVTSATNVQGLTCVNPLPAVGGSDVETYQEVQERFFTLIRRKNPVSAQDWQDFFTDFYGVGTLTSVQPNRPNQGSYNYLTDYLLPNGQVSFFVLGPGGVELTTEQLERGQNVVNFSVPVENQGHLYPFTLSQVQYNITLTVDANGVYGTNLRDTSLNFRNRLETVLQPGAVFPATTDPTVSDVDAAFYSTFPDSLRFSDPHVEFSAAYNTPPQLSPAAATYTQVYNFTPSEQLLNINDLVEITRPVSVFYPVLSSFTPYSSSKPDQTIYGNLALQQIQNLVPGLYQQGDVAYWSAANGGDNRLHVILGNLSIGSQLEIPDLITKGKISGAMVYSPWVVNNSYQETSGTGAYAPEIVQYDYSADEFIPDPTSGVPLSQRPGAFVWVVAQNFTLNPSTNSISDAQSVLAPLIGPPVTPQELLSGNSYTAGTWVYTPQVGSGPNPVADKYYNYVDTRLGVVDKYAYVVSSFTYEPGLLTVSEYFDQLAEQAIIKEIVVQNADEGLPVYKYKPRFPVGTYLEYRTDAVSAPQYFIAASYFTPNSTDAQVLQNESLIFPLYLNTSQKLQFDTALKAGTLRTPTRMFRFFKGDRTFFRQGSKVLSYTATTNVTPLFEFYIYTANGVFVPTGEYPPSLFETSQYIPYFSPSYVTYSEDTILAEDGRNLYRVMKAFSPNPTAINWTNTTVVNTARIEEYEGNLLRYVNKYTCEEDILSQLGRDISAIKLGVAQITLVPKNKGRFTNSQENVSFVWENTASVQEVPQLSWYTGTSYAYTPPNYLDGTMKL